MLQQWQYLFFSCCALFCCLEDAETMTKPTQSRELILDILMEILEKGGYSHVVLRQALEKYQYLESRIGL